MNICLLSKMIISFICVKYVLCGIITNTKKEIETIDVFFRSMGTHTKLTHVHFICFVVRTIRITKNNNFDHFRKTFTKMA